MRNFLFLSFCLALLSGCKNNDEESENMNPLSDLSNLSTEELIALESTSDVDTIVMAFEQALFKRYDLDKLTRPEITILAVEALEREVNNGGYHQFFSNSSKELAPHIVRALNDISCTRTVQVTQEAIDALNIPGKITENSVDQAIESGGDQLSSTLDEIDSEFFKGTEHIAAHLFEYIKQNKDKIKTKL